MLTKLLGKNYKWWYLVKYNFDVNSSGAFSLVIAQLSIILNTLTLTYVWAIGQASAAVFTYLLLGRIYRGLIESFGATNISQKIITGGISKDLILPQPYFKIDFFNTLGERFVHNPINVTAYIFAAIVAFNTFATFYNSDPLKILLLVLFVPISFYIFYILNFIFGLSAFFFKDPRNFTRSYQSFIALHAVLTGLYIPLDKLALPLIENTPFAYILHQPMQIYLGKYNQNQTILVFLNGLAWCIVLYFLAKIMFKLGLKRNESVGL